jgi:subtilisin family serine protease
VPDAVSVARVEVVVGLAARPAALAGWRVTRPASPRSRTALAPVERAQRTVAGRIQASIPGARIRWRYGIVLAGLAVSLPASELALLDAVPGVARVYPSVRYRPLSDPVEARLPQTFPGVIGAPALWGPALEHAGQGMKIAVIDDGIDQRHPFFDPAGLTMPPGFPKGNTAYTSAKVIAARAFAPPDAGWRNADKPYDPDLSFHGMHVAGIAAGAPDTPADAGGDEVLVSGVAPLAYLGNYKALTVPTDSDVGLNGNSPELVAAIEAAVADGMDVINMSLGELEIEPSRDAVAIALDNAAIAGVVTVVAAGNDYDLLGRGSVTSPGTADRAITVAAAGDDFVMAGFSSSGPTPLGNRLKPDVTAPGVAVLSAQPGDQFGFLSGTSMAAPHVAGAAALLRSLHPAWTVEDLKSALVSTGLPVFEDAAKTTQADTTRGGGGMVRLGEATDPLVFASPQTVTFGLLDARAAVDVSRTVELTDAGGGAGPWAITLEKGTGPVASELELPPEVSVPGAIAVQVHVASSAPEGERTGFVVLQRGADKRRLPVWYRVVRPRLPEEPARTLAGPGTYSGNTRTGVSLVSSYRYPDRFPYAPRLLSGPEQVFRVVLTRPVANLGVAIVGSGRGVRVQPRIVRGSDENRLAGASALPFVANPYVVRFLTPSPSVAALLPAPDTYSLVFDTAGPARAGRFRFRLWIDDAQPPSVSLRSRTAVGGQIHARVLDAGAGVDPGGIRYRLDNGSWRSGHLTGTIAILPVAGVRPGSHRLELRVSDRQEAKNNENVATILPNTRVVITTIRVPRR